MADSAGLQLDNRKRDGEGLQVNRESEGLQPNPNSMDYMMGPHGEFQRRRVLGLSLGMFWLVIVVLALIIAGAIGGGVAGGLSAQKKGSSAQSSGTPTSSSSSSLSSPSSSSSSTTSSATSGPSPSLTTPCTNNPSVNGTILTANDASGIGSSLAGIPHSFVLLCNTNYPAGAAYNNPGVVDLIRLLPTPLDMNGCIDACAQYNLGAAVAGGGPECKAVAVVKAAGDYCYLKSATGINDTSSSGAVGIDSAVLVAA